MFAAGAEDIFIVGYPKSGNTWFQNLVVGAVYGMDPRRAGVPGLAQVAVGQGWRPLTGCPFDDELAAAIHDISRVLLGAPPTVTGTSGVQAGSTE